MGFADEAERAMDVWFGPDMAPLVEYNGQGIRAHLEQVEDTDPRTGAVSQRAVLEVRKVDVPSPDLPRRCRRRRSFLARSRQSRRRRVDLDPQPHPRRTADPMTQLTDRIDAFKTALATDAALLGLGA